MTRIYKELPDNTFFNYEACGRKLCIKIGEETYSVLGSPSPSIYRIIKGNSGELSLKDVAERIGIRIMDIDAWMAKENPSIPYKKPKYNDKQKLSILKKFASRIADQKELPPKFAKVLNDNFWDLIA